MPKNVVLILVDDATPYMSDAMSYLSSDPEGNWVTFKNGVCTRALCGPSRLTIQTGLTVRRHGVGLNIDENTVEGKDMLAVRLQKVGYKTGVFGKWQLSVNRPGNIATIGGAQVLALSGTTPVTMNRTGIDIDTVTVSEPDSDTEYTENEYVLTSTPGEEPIVDDVTTIARTSGSMIPDGSTVRVDFQRTTDNGVGRRNQVEVGWNKWCIIVNGKYGAGDPVQPFFDVNEDGSRTVYNGLSEPVEDQEGVDNYSTDWIAAKAIGWMQEQHAAGHPFYAYIPVQPAHIPAYPAARHADTFEQSDIPVHPKFNVAEPLNIPPSWAETENPLSAEVIAEQEAKHLSVFRVLLAMDEAVESIIDALDAMGELDNTVIMFCTDNNNAYGAYGLTDKQHLIPEVLRVGMKIRYPGATQREVTTPVATTDFLSTILDIAGGTPTNTPDGMSIVPMLDGTIADDEFREFQYVERKSSTLSRNGSGLIGDRWLYVKYPDGLGAGLGHEGLYDMDQVSMVSVADDHPEQFERMRAALTTIEANIPPAETAG